MFRCRWLNVFAVCLFFAVLPVLSGFISPASAQDAQAFTTKAPRAILVDAATGAITIAAGQTLDFETAASHGLTITASDGTLSDTALITVNVNNLDGGAHGGLEKNGRMALGWARQRIVAGGGRRWAVQG